VYLEYVSASVADGIVTEDYLAEEKVKGNKVKLMPLGSGCSVKI